MCLDLWQEFDQNWALRLFDEIEKKSQRKEERYHPLFE